MQSQTVFIYHHITVTFYQIIGLVVSLNVSQKNALLTFLEAQLTPMFKLYYVLNKISLYHDTLEAIY